MTKYSLSFVVPTFNEEESVETLYEEIECVVKRIAPPAFEVIFVDDGSTDQTPVALERLIKEHPEHVKIVTLRANFGKSEALMGGFRVIKNDLIVLLDADLQDDPSCLPYFLALIDKGFEFVSGWKKLRHDPLDKRIPSRFFNWVMAKLSGIPIHDFNCGFKVFRRDFIKGLIIYGNQHRFLPIFAKHRGFRIGEVEVKHRPRRYGSSKYGNMRLLTGSFDLITLFFLTRFSFAPLHVFGPIGLLLFFTGTGFIFFLELRKFIFHIPIGAGRPFITVAATFAVLGAIFIAFGIISELVISLIAKVSDTNRVASVKSNQKEESK